MTLPWYPRDMGKYARDTGTLTMLQHGAYNLLLDHYYSTGPLDAFEQCGSNASLMPDHSPFYRVCKAMTAEEQRAVDYVINRFFILDGNFYRNKKCDEVIEIQTQKHGNRVRAGKTPKRKQCLSNGGQKENKTKTHREDTSVSSAKGPPKPSSVEISMWFENVWQAYPGRGKDGATGTAYKGGKQDALKAFTKIINKTEETDHEALVRNIIAGCQHYAGHLDRSGYPSKHCSTWLNASGWSDDYDSTASLPAAGGRAGYSLNAVMQGALADKTNLGPEGRTERLARLGISTFASDAGAGSVLGGPVAGALPAPGRDQGPDRD